MFLNSLINHKKYLWGIFFALSSLIYLPTAKAKFLFDINMFWLRYRAQGYAALFTNNYHDHSVRPVFHTVYYFMCMIVGNHPFVWAFITNMLHVSNAVLLFWLLQRMLPAKSAYFYFFSSLLFLLSPFFSEAMIWGAAFHYVYTASLFLMMAHFILNYIKDGKFYWGIAIFLLQLIAVFANEFAFAFFPALMIIFIFNQNEKFALILKRAVPLFLLLLVASFVYFAATKMVLGKWIGHYGAKSHLNTDFGLYALNICRNYSRAFLFTNNYAGFYQFFGKTWVYFLVLGITFMLIMLSVYAFFRGKKAKQMALLFLLSFFLFAPSINLYTDVYMPIQCSRYFYYTALFAYPLWVYFFFILKEKWAISLSLLYVIISCFFLFQTAKIWYEIGELSENLVNSFRWEESENIVILTNADNYKGAYFMRNQPQEEDAFSEMLAVQRNIDIRDRVINLGQFAMQRKSDSLFVHRAENGKTRVELAQWGNWWFRDGNSISNFDITYKGFELNFDKDYSKFYDFSILDSNMANATFIYQCGGNWHEWERE